MIAEIEDGIIAAVKSAPFGYRLGIVDSYGGELSGDENAMATLMTQFPAVWVAYQGETEPVPYSTAKQAWSTVATFSLFVATRSARGEKFTRHSVGPTTEVGAYRIVEDLRTLFVNQDLGLSIQQFKPGRVKSLFNKKLLGQTIAVFAVDLHCKYVIDEIMPTAAPDLLAINFGLFLNSTAESEPDLAGIVTL